MGQRKTYTRELKIEAAENELLHHLRDALDAESAVDEGVFAFVLFRDALKILFKQNLEVIDTARPVHPPSGRGDWKGQLSSHIAL